MTYSADLSDFERVLLEERDVDSCLELSSSAGWNQTDQDWRFHLDIGEGVGLRAPSGALIATGVILPAAAGVGWIAMVLVSEPYRRRGLGRKVMETVMSKGDFPCLALDATEFGVSLYERLGFRPMERIVRYRLHRSGDPVQPARREGSTPADEVPFLGIARALAARSDVRLIQHNGADCLLRPGRYALHIGPLAADSENAAAGLVQSVLDVTEGDVLVDVPSRLGTFSRRLERTGFSAGRTFVRMARGGSFLVDPGLFAITGPEYG